MQESHNNIGALVIGGDHPGLAVARSLGRRGIPVYVLEDQLSVSQWSRYVDRGRLGISNRNGIDS